MFGLRSNGQHSRRLGYSSGIGSGETNVLRVMMYFKAGSVVRTSLSECYINMYITISVKLHTFLETYFSTKTLLTVHQHTKTATASTKTKELQKQTNYLPYKFEQNTHTKKLFA